MELGRIDKAGVVYREIYITSCVNGLIRLYRVQHLQLLYAIYDFFT